MNLKKLSDQNLLTATQQLAKQEREILTTILHHLREVERRRLYSVLKYSSLFSYAVGELKYSEDQAARRIAAMRLMRDVPEIEEKISSGALTLSNLCLAQTLFTKERQAGRQVNTEGKIEVLGQLENLSAREAKKFVAEINPEMKWTRKLDFDAVEDEDLRAKLLQVKGLFAHIDPNMSLKDVLHRLCDSEIAKKSRLPEATKSKLRAADSKINSPATTKVATAATEVAESPATSRADSKAEIRRQVWRRDQGRCTRCSSTHAVQEDHIVPRAAGGMDALENLRLLCRSCNHRAAIEYFGLGKMDRFINKPKDYENRAQNFE